MAYTNWGDMEQCPSNANTCRVQEVSFPPWASWGPMYPAGYYWPSAVSMRMPVPRPTYLTECESMVSTPCDFSVEPDSCHLGVQAAARGAPLPVESNPRKQVAALMGYTNYLQSCTTRRPGSGVWW